MDQERDRTICPNDGSYMIFSTVSHSGTDAVRDYRCTLCGHEEKRVHVSFVPASVQLARQQ